MLLACRVWGFGLRDFGVWIGVFKGLKHFRV